MLKDPCALASTVLMKNILTSKRTLNARTIQLAKSYPTLNNTAAMRKRRVHAKSANQFRELWTGADSAVRTFGQF